jgi:hypothetical protein
MADTISDSLEIVISPDTGYSDAGGLSAVKAKEALDSLGNLLIDAIEPFRRKIEERAASIHEIELRLELSLKGEGKWIVVSASAGATVGVKLIWRK